MCGIAGAWDPRGRATEEDLRRMAGTLAHRGPDDAGTWLGDGGVGLAQRRLAIVDLSPAGHQPMVCSRRRFIIVFNGEIYNHLQIRAELEAQAPHTWRGHSDTETLLEGFTTWGVERTLRMTRGMFAFAAYDTRNRELILGRDRFGEKPLYYGWQGGALLFGSELKALRAFPDFNAVIDRAAVAAFMRYSYIPAPRSIYAGIFKLPPGTVLTLRHAADMDARPIAYWSAQEVARAGIANPFAGSEHEAVDELDRQLREAIELQRLADVPLGAFLSGGVDSSVIVSLMQAQSTERVRTFSIGFEDQSFNEAEHARSVAEHLGTDHSSLYVTEAELRDVIPRLSSLYDEPFADSSQIPTHLVSRIARQRVTVCLSGDGGDELFGGYPRYSWTRRLLGYPTLLRMLGGHLAGALSARTWNVLYRMSRARAPGSLRGRAPGDGVHKLAALLKMATEEDLYLQQHAVWKDPAAVNLSRLDGDDLRPVWRSLSDLPEIEQRMMLFDMLTYLPDQILCKVDRAAMGVSLETRVPFLDPRVVEFAWRIPTDLKFRHGVGKWILRQLLYRYVPQSLVDRPKAGFSMPVDTWLRGPLRDWAEDLLSESTIDAAGLLDARAVRHLWQEHLSGVRNWQHPLWSVLILHSWLRSYA
jgi:asparagine synthase (glutamine-hydrolysing)